MKEATPMPIKIDEALAVLDDPQHLADANLWPGLTPQPATWSGTKGYTWAEAYGDVQEALKLVWDTCCARQLCVQGASRVFFHSQASKPESAQAHKGLVITFPRRATLQADIAAIVEALGANWSCASKPAVRGAELAGNGFSTRFEHRLDMGRDVDQYEHALLYIPSEPFMKEAVIEMAAKIRKLDEP